MCEPEFYLFYVEEDDSFCIVPCSDVLCIPPVSEGDVLKFYFKSDGKRRSFHGEVKAMGDDYHALNKELARLHKNRERVRRRQKSKYSRKGRKNREKENQSNSRKHNQQNDYEVQGKSETPRKQSVDSDVTDINDSDTSPELTQEEVSSLLKDAQRKKRDDIRSLRDMNSSKFPTRRVSSISSDSSDDEPLIKVAQHRSPAQFLSGQDFTQDYSPRHGSSLKRLGSNVSQSREINRTPSSLRDGRNSQHFFQSEDEDDNLFPKVKKIQQKRRRRRYAKLEFLGQYYRFKEGDTGVVKLWDKYDVHVSEKELRHIRKASKTGPMMARLLLKAIYTGEACAECSPTGRPSGLTKKQRPPLDRDGIDASVEFINQRAERRRWPLVTATQVKKSFSDVLCEDRYQERLEAQERQSHVAESPPHSPQTSREGEKSPAHANLS